MCCLSEASSHFVVFVCVNPDRKPSRKMKRQNKIIPASFLFYHLFLYLCVLRKGIINKDLLYYGNKKENKRRKSTRVGKL